MDLESSPLLIKLDTIEQAVRSDFQGVSEVPEVTASLCVQK